MTVNLSCSLCLAIYDTACVGEQYDYPTKQEKKVINYVGEKRLLKAH